MLDRDGRRPQAQSSRRRQGPPVRSPSLFHLLACRNSSYWPVETQANLSHKMGSHPVPLYQNVCEVAVRVKPFWTESVVSFSWASYNWGWPGRARSRIPHPARRGDDGQRSGRRQPVSRREYGTGRRSGAGDSGAAGPAVPAQPGQPAHQREPRLRHGAPGGAGLRLLADRGALRRHHPAG